MDRNNYYVFTPLRPYHIRLVKLLSASCECEIHIELSETSLEHLESFTYISHVWLPREVDHHSIECNGQTLNVRGNLFRCLQELIRKRWTQPLWVDSLCVNQSSVKEKNEQVRLIPEITWKASTTILWLGQGSHEITLFFQHCLAGPDLPGPDDVILPEIESGLSQVVSNEAFRRLWVVLDIVHAQNLMVWCGRSECFYEDLVWILRLLYRDSENPIARSSASARIVLADELRSRYQFWLPMTYTEVVQASRHFNCMLPVDRAFAPMDIIGVWPMEPDYRLPTHEVFMRTARGINSEIFPASLSMLEDNPISSILPSWVPDLEIPVQRKLLIQTGRRFSASADRDIGLIVDETLSALIGPQERALETFTCAGLVTDTLTDVFDYNPVRQWYDERNLKALNNSFLTMWFDSVMLASRRKHELARRRVFPEFVETLLALPSDQIRNGAAERMETAEAWLRAIQGESDEITERMKDFHEACAFTFGRRFGVTSRGQYCLIPKRSQPRDSVCILFGSNVPFILRRAEEGWENIGECYVHGIMNGESLDRDTNEHEVFHIR